MFGSSTAASAVQGYIGIETSANASITGDAVGDLTITPYSVSGTPTGISFGASNSGFVAMKILNSGFVGIGTTNPGQLLHVYKASAGIAATFQNTAGTCTFTPTSGATSWSCSSDERLKKDIVDTGVDGLVWLGDMRVRDYTLKVDDARLTGVIAQELIKTHPDMVHMGDDGLYTVDAPNPWKLVKAIQELKALFDADHGLLAKLQALFEGDHKEIEALKAANDNQAKEIEELRAMALKQQQDFDAYKKAHK
jgi:hypothetical protein